MPGRESMPAGSLWLSVMLRIYEQPSYFSHSSELQNVTWNGFSVSVEHVFTGLPGREDSGGPRPGFSNKTSFVPTVAFCDWINEKKTAPCSSSEDLYLHFFVFSPSLGTKEGVRTVHGQVHTQGRAAWVSPGCHDNAATLCGDTCPCLQRFPPHLW